MEINVTNLEDDAGGHEVLGLDCDASAAHGSDGGAVFGARPGRVIPRDDRRVLRVAQERDERLRARDQHLLPTYINFPIAIRTIIHVNSFIELTNLMMNCYL
jgi:hypothetical protein